MDFVRDLIVALKAELSHAGIAYDDSDDAFRFLRKYINFCERQIRPTTRRVHVSQLVTQKLETASPAVDAGYREILARAEAGGDLRPFQSKALRWLEDNDYLLNDWGIQHLHLEVARTTDPFFVDRSEQLLFAVFEDEEAFFVDIRPHGEEAVWASTELMRTIKSCWPQLLERNRLPHMVAGGQPFSAPERHKLRRAGVNPILELDGECYAARGGGLSGAATNFRHVHMADCTLQRVRALEKAVRQERHEIVAMLRNRGYAIEDDAEFEFVHDGSYCRIRVEDLPIVVKVTNFDATLAPPPG